MTDTNVAKEYIPVETSVVYTFPTTLEHLVEQVDAAGGWPVWAKSLKYIHVCHGPSPCSFHADTVNSEWRTVCLTADEYYWAKVSDTRKNGFARQAVSDAAMRMMMH